MDTLNEASRERPRGALIASIERESRLMRDVQRENGELRAALEDHRRALELIMSKYRQHTEKRIWESRIDFTNAINEKQQEVNYIFTSKLEGCWSGRSLVRVQRIYY